jgi:hypothetical protein
VCWTRSGRLNWSVAIVGVNDVSRALIASLKKECFPTARIFGVYGLTKLFAHCSATSSLDTRQALRIRLGLCFPQPDGYCERARFGQAEAAGAEAFGFA